MKALVNRQTVVNMLHKHAMLQKIKPVKIYIGTSMDQT